MSRTTKKRIEFRVAVPQTEDKNHAERALQFTIETEGFSGEKDERALALRFIMDQALLGFSREDTPQAIRNVLDVVKCPYLRRGVSSYLCGETMKKKKEATDLGVEPELVIAGCLDCIRKKEEERALEIEKILMKASIVKMREFFVQFMKLSYDGLGVDLSMCRGALLNGMAIISVDGVTLRCPHLDNQYVEIDKVCLQKVNPKLGLGCEFFIKLEHFVDLDDMGIIQRKEVPIRFTPQPCSDSIEDRCPGVDECNINQRNLAKANKYCPERYKPGDIVPLLEAPEEPLQEDADT
jgi:hypothetical protein